MMILAFLWADFDPLVYILDLGLGPVTGNKLALIASGDWVRLLRYFARIWLIFICAIELTRTVVFGVLTIFPILRETLSSLRCLRELRPKLGVKLHDHLAIIWSAMEPLFETAATGFYFAGLFEGGISFYLVINGHNVLSPLLYGMAPFLSFFQILTTTIQLCISVNEVSRELRNRGKWGLYGMGLKTKYYRKRARASKPLRVDFAVNGFRFSSLVKETKTQYYVAELEWVINLLLSLPREQFEASVERRPGTTGI